MQVLAGPVTVGNVPATHPPSLPHCTHQVTLEGLATLDGHPDVVPVQDGLLVQEDDCGRRGLLSTEAVSGGLGHRTVRPGGPGGEADGRLGEPGQEDPAETPSRAGIKVLS